MKCIEPIAPNTKTVVLPISTSFFAATIDFGSLAVGAAAVGVVPGPMAFVVIQAASPTGADTIAPPTRAG